MRPESTTPLYDAGLTATAVDIGLQDPQTHSALQAYIAAKYQEVHCARLAEFLPFLLGIRTHGQLAGAFGIRPGSQRPLFLEQYLDLPIEQLVAQQAQCPVDRHSLVEIGNLVVTGRGQGPLIMLLMATCLAQAGFSWMVFTVTEQVEKMMRRLGFCPQLIAHADPGRLQNPHSHWGSYYQNNPRVMVGSLASALTTIASNPRYLTTAALLRPQINAVASALRTYNDKVNAQ